MQRTLDYVASHPWLWVLAAASLLVWISALRVMLTSPKFLRKGWWVLLSLVNLYLGDVSGATTVSVAIPLGALYILGFRLIGPTPSPVQLERHIARSRPPELGSSSWRPTALRWAYVAAALAVALIGWLAASGDLLRMMVRSSVKSVGGISAESVARLDAARLPQGLLAAALVCLCVFLAARPYWWGKLLCGVFGAFWILWCARWFATSGPDPALVWILVAGVAMLGAGIVHQVADPRFRGAYLRAA